ncbi:2-hydroxy-acid oxidase [Clostridia bacterium]|nr:2-hydroxy-acid oxidase [Clostridia bacterium]
MIKQLDVVSNATFSVITPSDITFFTDLLPGRALFGEDILEDYERDEMTEYGRYRPDAVLFAKTVEEVSEILRYCNERRLPVTLRGAGTGLCGGCVPVCGGVVLSTERMNRVLEVDTRNSTATVEAGVLLMDLPKALEGTGLFYPPDPGEKTATMGGNAMTNAGGMRAVRFGVTRDYVLGMEVVLASGEALTLGGKVAKNSSGYSLIDLLIGSEGTLAVLTKLTVKLIPEPKVNLSVLALFDDLERCVEAVPSVLQCGEPTAVEFMEKEVIDAAQEYLGKPFPNPRGNACLLVRVDGPSRAALESALDMLTDLLLGLGAKDVLLADTDERKQSIWNARGAFLEAIIGSTTSIDECDVVVPRDRVASFVRQSVRIGRECGVRVRSFGHAGDGNLHIYVCKDGLTDGEWAVRREAAMDALYAVARELGGQVSGEHGIGHAKAGYLEESIGGTQVELMRGIKAVFDPNGILNPGKVIRP